MAGAAVASTVMAHATTGGALQQPVGALLMAIALGGLMVSSIPFRGWKTLQVRRRDLTGIAITLGLTLVMAVQYDISWAFFVCNLVYSASGPVEALLTRRWRVSDHDAMRIDAAR